MSKNFWYGVLLIVAWTFMVIVITVMTAKDNIDDAYQRGLRHCDSTAIRQVEFSWQTLSKLHFEELAAKNDTIAMLRRELFARSPEWIKRLNAGLCRSGDLRTRSRLTVAK